MIIEACVENYSEALAAKNAGANRIELCENLAVGGTTPSFGTIKLCCSGLKIPVVTMIRPRGGNFVYTDQEFEIMQADVEICRNLGSSAIVFGFLTKNNEIDTERTKMLVQLAQPLKTVFHKAFDEVPDPFEALEQLVDSGISRILTSGTKNTALEGQEILRKLIDRAAGRIAIVVAGGVTYENITQLQQFIPATEFHGRKIVNPR